mmetsp:Transcript_6357/g.17854  ORF Transcript_6357/g.17854 Transcript_6357/m.17854 type:complete len:210 (-) Transcript_6357:850-1479(-)
MFVASQKSFSMVMTAATLRSVGLMRSATLTTSPSATPMPRTSCVAPVAGASTAPRAAPPMMPPSTSTSASTSGSGVLFGASPSRNMLARCISGSTSAAPSRCSMLPSAGAAPPPLESAVATAAASARARPPRAAAAMRTICCGCGAAPLCANPGVGKGSASAAPCSSSRRQKKGQCGSSRGRSPWVKTRSSAMAWSVSAGWCGSPASQS